MIDFLGKAPPHDEHAELRVLHACISKPQSVSKVADALKPGDFYLEKHEVIYKTILGFHARGKRPVTPRIVQGLRAAGDLEVVGGMDFIHKLADMFPTTAGFMDSAGVVLETSRARAVIGACLDTMQKGFGGYGDIDEFCQEAVERLSGLAAQSMGQEVLHLGREAQGLYDSLILDMRPDIGLLTKIDGLDQMTCGLQPGELTVVAGPPSMGKTAFALSISLTSDVPVLMFSLEQPRKQMAYRCIAAQSGVSVQKIRRPDAWSDDEGNDIGGAVEKLLARDIYLDDRTPLSVVQMGAAAREQKAKKGIGLIVVDYIDLVVPKEGARTREREIAGISAGFKGLAMELSIPVVLISQMNRAFLGRKTVRPRIEDLRGSGAVGQDADLLLFPWRPMQLEDAKDVQETMRRWQREGCDEPAEIIIGKNRNGPIGSVPVWWNGKRMIYKDRQDGVNLDVTMRQFQDKKEEKESTDDIF